MFKKALISIMRLLRKIKEDKIFSLSAQFSYFIILGIFPFLILAISMLCNYSDYIYYILNSLSPFLPQDVYNIIINIINYSISSCNKPYLSASMLVILWSATSGSVTIISGINRAYGFTTKTHYLFLRLKGIILSLAIMIAMQIIFTLIVAGSQILIFLEKIEIFSSYNYFFINVFRYATPFVFLFVIFSGAYKFLPYEKVKFSFVFPGALFASLGFIIDSYAYSYYISIKILYYNSIYGNLSGLFVFIVWIYMLSIIFLTGAEVNFFASKRTMKIKKI
ncbi:MAG: YihY/virulence factor BrkB family protein [Sedimentibacter sp.]